MGTAIFIQTLINGLSLASLYILMAIGLTYIFSIMRIINFAHGEILMLGAYVSYLLIEYYHFHFFLSLIFSMVVIGLFGLFLERYVFRPRKGEDLNLLVLSLGLAITLQSSAMLAFSPEDRGLRPIFTGVLNVQDIFISKVRLVALLAAAICILGSQLFLKRTKLGIALEAVSQDEEGASLQGIRINRYTALTFAIGCALAAAAGSLLAPIFVVSPFMGTLPVVKAFIVIVLGGLGSMIGAMMGGLILGLVESLTATYLGATIQEVSGFLLLLLILIFKPGGMFGERE